MKNTVLAVICLAFAVLASSCVRFVDEETGRPLAGPHNPYPPSGSYGNQGGKMTPGGRSLKPFYPGQKPDGRMKVGERRVQTGTKKELRHHVQAFIWTTDDQSQKDEIATYALQEYKKTGQIPSQEHLTEKYGVKCKAELVK